MEHKNPDLKNRLSDIIDISYEILCNKISAGSINVYNEAYCRSKTPQRCHSSVSSFLTSMLFRRWFIQLSGEFFSHLYAF